MKFETKFISPHMAEALLATNPINRSANLDRVLFYESEMNAGKWTMNGQGIIVSTTGKLIDGQKRLFAIIRHGKPVEMLIISDVAEEAFRTIDSGQPRQVADTLGIMGIPYPSVVAAGCAIVWKMIVGAPVRAKFSSPYALQVYERFPAFRKWIGHVGSINKVPLPQAQLIAAIVYLEDIAKRPLAAEHLFKGIVKGSDLAANDPVLTLRNRVLTHRTSHGNMGVSTVWPGIAQTLSALEDEKTLEKVYLGSNKTSLVVGPKALEANLKLLPPRMLLHDLPPPEDTGSDKRKAFNEYVKQVRGTNEVRPSVNT
jgi:hypothetical protein